MDFVYLGTCVYFIASIISIESLTFTTKNLHDGKWIIKHGATDILICRNNPYTGKLSLIYEKQRVAECSKTGCKTYFTDYGAFNITFDIKNGEIQWKINHLTTKYDGKLFKCSDGTETLRLSPIVQESLTFTTENIHDGKWKTKDGATDILICRNNPFTGMLILEYENRLIAECIVNSCKSYFTDNGAFKIQHVIRSGQLKWKISPMTMKYNGKIFKCSNGLETLRLSPIVEHVEDTDRFISRNFMHLCVLVLVLALSLFAIRSHSRAVQPSLKPGKREQLSDTDNNSLGNLEQTSYTDDSTTVTAKAREKGTLSAKSIPSIINRENKIMKKDITFEKLLGEGKFGKVWKGVWRRNGKDKKVALKTFKTVKSEQVGVHFEVELMQDMDHENIVQFLGTCMYGDKCTIVMELIEKGNLLQYLPDERGNLETPAFVDIASQIVKGLIYLESQKIIHRDLAARNILVSSFSEGKTIKTVKIADFGLARRLRNENSEYRSRERELIPTRWTAPEALEHNVFTFKSDVWSFGILLMEMVTFGERPYEGSTNPLRLEDKDILPYLKQSPENRMKCPKHCHPELYQTMQMCWKLDRAERPTFQEIKQKLDKLS